MLQLALEAVAAHAIESDDDEDDTPNAPPKRRLTEQRERQLLELGVRLFQRGVCARRTGQ